MFYTAFEGLSAGIMSACPPYGYDFDSTVGHPLFEEPFVSASTGTTNGQPFPSPIPTFGASRQHPNTTVDWSKYSPITGDPAFYYRNASPYTESYNLSVERGFGQNTIFTVGYVGARAHNLLVLTPASPGDADRCLSVSDPSQVASGSNTCGPFSEGGLFTRKDGKQVEARGPLDNSSSLSEEVNPIEPRINKAISAFDVRHNVEFSYLVFLPLEKLLPGPRSLTMPTILVRIMKRAYLSPVRPSSDQGFAITRMWAIMPPS